jgi:hypothetical protein
MPRVENGRWPAGYYFRARARANERQLSLLSDEQFEELGVVNQIRRQVWTPQMPCLRSRGLLVADHNGRIMSEP